MSNGEIGQIIKINSKSKGIEPTHPPRRNFVDGPVVDKFFLVAILSTILGTLGFGWYLWLTRLGYLLPQASYLTVRELHGVIQLYLFFGLSICGFIIQAAPRILDIGRPISFSLTMWILIVPPCAVIIEGLSAPSPLSRFMLATSPILTAGILLARQGRRALRPHSLFILLAMSALALGVRGALGDPMMALTIFWLSVGAALLGTSHLFIVNLLGGTPVKPRAQYLLLCATTAAGVLLLQHQTVGAAVIAVSTLLYYLAATSLLSRAKGPTLLQTGFKLGFLWAIVGWLVLLFEPTAFDKTLHILSTGWGVSILFPLSLHIVGFLARFGVRQERRNVIALVAWQLIPLSRGVGIPPNPSGWYIGVVSFVSLVFMGNWLWSILLRSYALITGTHDKHHNEIRPACASVSG